MKITINTRSKIPNLVTIVLSLLLVITSVGTGTIYNNQALGQQLTFAQFETSSPPSANSNSPATKTPPLEDGTTNGTDVTSQQQPNVSSTVDFSTYSSPEFGFTIQYPSNWRALPFGFNPTQIVSFISPLENIQDVIPARVGISRNDYLNSVTLEEYTQRSLDILQSVGANISQSPPTTPSSTTLSGMPAHMVVTNNTAVAGTMDMVIWSVTTDGQMVYIITYSATPQDFEQYRPIFNEMVNSFQIIEEGGSSIDDMQQPQQQQPPNTPGL
jgi:hypothetical protein